MALGTIVVIEDDPLARQNAVEMLEAAGVDVAGFDDGERALDYIREHRHEVAGVFTDINLVSQTDGLEVAHLVTQTFPAISVVVTSGRYATRPPGLADSVRFLVKPWFAVDVINAVIDTTQEK